MTKITTTAFNRKYQKLHEEDDKYVKRIDGPIVSFPQSERNCAVCGKPFRVSMGQIVKGHGGACRSTRRRAKLRFGN